MTPNPKIVDKKKEIIYRAGLLYSLLLIAGIAVFGKIVYLQVVKYSEYHEKYINGSLKMTKVFSERADIYDMQGNVLATFIPQFDIYFDTRAGGLKDTTFQNNIDSLAICLAKILPEKTKKQIKNELVLARRNRERYHMITTNVDFDTYKKIKSFPIFRKGKNKGGFIWNLKTKRTMPFNNLARTSIGMLRNEVTNGQQVGERGLEKYYDEILRGLPGSIWKQKLPLGNSLPVENSENVYPEAGKNIVSSLDINLQDYANQVLEEQLKKSKAHHGVVIVMEVKTGYIKAMVNLALTKDSNYVENYNYAVKNKIAPGSTFKLASYMAAFEDSYIKLTDTVDAGNGTVKYYDFTVTDTKESGYGKLTVQQAFEHSSNVATTKIIRKYYKNNEQKFIDRLYDIGIYNLSGIDLAGEEMPNINTPKSEKWSGASLPAISYGYEVLFTPMQILTFYNAVANNGTMIKPRLVMAYSSEGTVDETVKTEIIKQAICSQKTLENVKIMLEGVVKNGTATNIYTDKYRIAGKTGTAKHFNFEQMKFIPEYSGSFVGYFPADNPKYSCIVLIDKPQGSYYGGNVAAPVFRLIADKIYAADRDINKANQQNNSNFLNTAPISKNGYRSQIDLVLQELNIQSDSKNKTASDWVDTKARQKSVELINQKINKKLVPDVVGMGARDAVWLLESLGLKVKITGRGTVKKQSIVVGKTIKKNMTVLLELEPS